MIQRRKTLMCSMVSKSSFLAVEGLSIVIESMQPSSKATQIVVRELNDSIMIWLMKLYAHVP